MNVRRRIAGMAAMILLFTSLLPVVPMTTMAVSETADTMMGDINRDGCLTTADVRVLLMHVVGNVELTAEQCATADVNGDGVADTADARMLLTKILNTDTETTTTTQATTTTTTTTTTTATTTTATTTTATTTTTAVREGNLVVSTVTYTKPIDVGGTLEIPIYNGDRAITFIGPDTFLVDVLLPGVDISQQTLKVNCSFTAARRSVSLKDGAVSVSFMSFDDVTVQPHELLVTLVITAKTPISQSGKVICRDASFVSWEDRTDLKGSSADIIIEGGTTSATVTTTTVVHEGNDLMQSSYIVTGSEHVAVQSDGSWLIDGPIVLKPSATYDYTQTPYLVQEHDATAPVTMTVVDRSPDGSYADRVIDLSDMWLDETAFPKGRFGNVGSLLGVYEWFTKHEGWNTADHTVTIDELKITPAENGTVTLYSLYLMDLGQDPFVPVIDDTITLSPKAVTPLTADAQYSRSLLDSHSRLVYDAICEMIRTVKKSTKIVSDVPLALGDAVNALYEDRADLYTFSVAYTLSLDGITDDGRLEYTVSVDEETYSAVQMADMWSYRQQIDLATRLLTDGITDSMTETERARAVFDNVVAWGIYDLTATHNQDLFGILVNRRGVCVSYAKAYQHLLRQCGVRALTIALDVLYSNEGHMITYVEMDGRWYVSDATWGHSYFRYDLRDLPLNALRMTSYRNLPDYTKEDYDYDCLAWKNTVTLTGDFDADVMAPYLAKAYRENGHVYFVCEDFDTIYYGAYNYFINDVLKNRKQELLDAVNRCLCPDEQLTEWPFKVNVNTNTQDGIVLGIPKT